MKNSLLLLLAASLLHADEPTLLNSDGTGVNAPVFRGNLGLIIGTDVQAYDADLGYLAGFTPSANVKSLLNAADYAAVRTALSLGELATLSSVTTTQITDGTITSADISTSAAIPYSKLLFVDGDLSIAKTNGLQTALDGKVNLTGGNSITGAQTITLTGTSGVGLNLHSSNAGYVGSLLTITDSTNGIYFSVGSDGAVQATSYIGDIGDTIGINVVTNIALDAKADVVHTHVSADITDATSIATPNAIVRRDGFGSAAFTNISFSNITGTGTFLFPDLASDPVLVWPNASGTIVLHNANQALTNKTYNGLTVTSSTGTLTIPNGITLNAGAGGTLGTAAYTAASAYATAAQGVTSLSLSTPNVIFATPINFANSSGAWTGTLSLNSQAANTVFGNFTAGSATPTFSPTPTFSGANITALNASQLTTGTLPTAASVSVQTVSSDAPATISSGIRQVFITASFASVPRALTLPAANSCPAGSPIALIRVSASTGQNGLITRAGSDTIAGASTAINIAVGDEPVYLYSDGVSNWSVGKKPVTSGGTGVTSYTVGDILYASGTVTLSKLADVATGSVLVSGGVGAAPAYSSSPTFSGVNLTNLPGANITGNIPVARIATALTTPGPIGGGTPSTGAFTTLTASGASTLSGGIVGTTTNSNATALTVGEYVANAVIQGSATALTTATPKTVTSISLTAGDWDVTGIGAITGASTGTSFDVAVGTTTNSFTGTFLGDSRCQTPTVSLTGADATLMIPAVRVSIASTTTVYLIVQETFTVGSPGAYGKLSARRVR